MTSLEFGDVVLVPFPFTDQSTTKKRPAVVISSTRYNTERPDLIIIAVTSQIRPTPSIGEVIVNGCIERRSGIRVSK
jgi:mRNA interferase MazF